MAYYKILRAPEWQALAASGRLAGSPDDLRDGFVHLSTAAQVEGTLARHYAGAEGLVLLTLDPARLDPAIKWETASHGGSYPHLFRAIESADILSRADLPLAGGRHVLPPL